MSDIKKARWTEAEVLALPAGEHDYFDRKSGTLYGTGDFRKDVAKALSAFANSGGGHLVLGVTDTGTIDGVPAVAKGRTRLRDWLEQIIPDLLDYTLEDFRVHEVEPATPSLIPPGQVVIVVDVGDSVLAPHQAREAKVYYYRAAGRSVIAPHFYLEALRNRLTAPVLVPMLTGLTVVKAFWDDDTKVFVQLRAYFRVTNTGRIAAYKWALVPEQFREVTLENWIFDRREFPKRASGGPGGIPLDDTILPGLCAETTHDFGFYFRPASDQPDEVLPQVKEVLGAVSITYRAVSEVSPGETSETRLASVLDLPSFTRDLLQRIEPNLCGP